MYICNIYIYIYIYMYLVLLKQSNVKIALVDYK